MTPAEIAISIVIFLPLFVFTTTALINSIFGPFLKKRIEPKRFPKASFIVPARNEEKNIAACLDSLLAAEYPDFEIIVYDDESSDRTAELVAEYSEKLGKVKLIRGTGLPENRFGKNNACFRAAEMAKGEILAFTDADMRPKPEALRNSIGYMQKFDLAMISAFPRQITKSFAEKLLVPIVDLTIYSFFILWTSRYVPFKAFAAANGQWIVFDRKTYFEIGGHDAVGREIVEDVALARLTKSRGYNILTCSGAGAVEGRMYENFGDIWSGLSKNLFGVTNYSLSWFSFLLISIFIGGVAPYFLFWTGFLYPAFLIALAANFLWRASLSLRFGQFFLVSVFLHPATLVSMIGIGINSIIKTRSGGFVWKGRQIDIDRK